MSNLRIQPGGGPGIPGQGPYGAPSVAAQYARMAPHEIAYQELLAHPPPLPVKFSPPLTDAEFAEALQMTLERIHDSILQFWDEVYAQRMGHISDAQFAMLFLQHEPLYEPGEAGGPVPNEWLHGLQMMCARQCADDLSRYAAIQQRVMP